MNNISVTQLKALLSDDATRDQALDRIGEWAKDNCLLFGAEAATAYKVASTLVSGISETYEDGEMVVSGWWHKRAKVRA